METKITMSISKDIAKGFKNYKVPFQKLKDLVKSDFNYSAGMFKDGHRKAENYLGRSNVVILDIDDGLSIKEARKRFEPITHIIATTKSHQKEKNGLVCDRFRVLLLCENEITLNSSDYHDLMKEIHKDFDFVDKACKDSSRFYYPSSDSIIQSYQGFCGFYWEDYWERVTNRKQAEAEAEAEKRRRKKKIDEAFLKNRPAKYDYNDGEKIDYIRKIARSEKILELLKHSERFVSGNRNHYLYSVGRYLQDLGMTDEEVKDTTLWINEQGDSVKEDELRKTIFKSLRLNGN